MVMSTLWGEISPNMCQKVMHYLKADLEAMQQGNLDTWAVNKLAKCGSEGRHSCHVWRDMQKLLPTPKLPKLHYEFLPLKHLKRSEFFQSMPLILPHELFSAIYHHYPVMFDKLVYGSQATCNSFWKAVAGGEQFRSLCVSLGSLCTKDRMQLHHQLYVIKIYNTILKPVMPHRPHTNLKPHTSTHNLSTSNHTYNIWIAAKMQATRNGHLIFD